MAHSAKKKQEARKFYIQGHSLRQAALIVEVNYQTVRNWKRIAADNGDNWDLARNARHMTSSNSKDIGQQVIEEFVVLFQSTIDSVKKAKDLGPMQKAEVISKLSDAYTKTVNSAARANPTLNKLAVVMDVLEDLAEFIKANKPDLLENFLELLEPFGAEIAVKYGK